MNTRQRITELPLAVALTGAETIPLVQDGQTRRGTVSDVASVAVQAFVALNISSFMLTVLDDTTAPAARSTLGAGIGDMLASNNLSDVGNAATARANLNLVIGTDVQAQDAELAALAGLTSAADRLPYFTGLGAASLATFTGFARTLLDDVDAATARATLGVGAGTGDMVGSNNLSDVTNAGTARTNLGVAIGVNVQAYDDDLAAIAGLTSAADKLPYFTGAGTAALTDLSSFIRTLLNDADAATARTTLGVASGSGDLVSTNNLSDVANVATARTNLGLGIGVNVQAYDGELTALAGLTSAADKLPYFTGAGTAALVDLSAFIRTLLNDADAATARTTLGVVIGTNVQAYDGELAAIAGLTSAADQLPYFTGAGTAALATLTSFARTLLDDTTAAAMRTTLGVATGDMVGANNLAVGAGGVANAATAFSNIKQAGSETATGVVELATPSEMVTGTDTTRVGTPAGDRAALASYLPAGVVVPYAGSTEPTGWLFCYGQAISRTTYAALFTAIGVIHGPGNGSTTFNLPDLRGRVAAGQDDMGGTSANRLTNQSGGLDGDTLGTTGGAETHTLTTAQMPSHTHTVAATSGYPLSQAGGGVAAGAGGGGGDAGMIAVAAGGGGAHNNVQPTIILNYIIRT